MNWFLITSICSACFAVSSSAAVSNTTTSTTGRCWNTWKYRERGLILRASLQLARGTARHISFYSNGRTCPSTFAWPLIYILHLARLRHPRAALRLVTLGLPRKSAPPNAHLTNIVDAKSLHHNNLPLWIRSANSRASGKPRNTSKNTQKFMATP